MRVIIFIFLIALLSFNVNALAVATDYLENGTLFLEEGSSKLYGARLQNSASGEIQVQLTYGDTLAKIIDYEETYTIPPKGTQSITFNITAPKDTKPGNTFTFGFTVHQVSGSGPGVPILLKINKNFKVKIIRNPDKIYLEDYSYIAYIVIAIALLLYIFRKNIVRLWKRKNKFSKTYLEKYN